MCEKHQAGVFIGSILMKTFDMQNQDTKCEICICTVYNICELTKNVPVLLQKHTVFQGCVEMWLVLYQLF